jgi:hypothetical protein
MLNLDKFTPETVGKWGIPAIKGTKSPPNMLIWESYRERKNANPANVGIHFFIDDYRFENVWTQPDRHVDILRKYAVVLSPDFSMYTDFPLALQINSHYRKHWLGAYWQRKGITVIPTICWSEERSFEWCFDGKPEKSTVAISSVGTQLNERSKRLIMLGFRQMMSRLQPKTVLFHGRIPADSPVKMEGTNGDNSPIIVPIAA